MHILILGGTQFVGRHITEQMLAGGHTVSVFNRGRSPDALPEAVERLRGDRDAGAAGLGALAGRAWDVCVDVSGYTARQVRPSIERLGESVRRYVYVSTVSVYPDSAAVPVTEDHPLSPPADEAVVEVNGETYGPLKVTCENIVRAACGNRATILRPQIIAGPHDPTGRFPYWVNRAAQAGEMLAPGDGSDHVQMIDVRDLARFTRTVIEDDRGGVFNLAGPRLSWAEFLQHLGARELAWVPAGVLAAAGVTPSELPLYRAEPGERSPLMHVSHERATAAGLTLTDFARTVADVQDWLKGHPLKPALSALREAELISLARRQAAN